MSKAAATLTIEHLTAVEWRCPYCETGNAVPEVTVCACGAVREGNTATAPAQGSAAAAPEKTVTTRDKPDDDEG